MALLIVFTAAWLVQASPPAYGLVLVTAFGASKIAVPIAFVVLIVLGIPAALALQWRGWTRFWQFALLGAVLGTVFIAPGVALALGGRIDRLVYSWSFLGTVDGWLSASVFWSIAIRHRGEIVERTQRGAA